MLIGVDASRAFSKRRTGVENYSYQLLLALANLECQHEFLVYAKGSVSKNQKISSQFLDSRLLHLTSKAIAWPFLWTQGGLALETWLRPPDLLFIPAHTVPFLKNPRVKTVVTVHDLWTQDLPQTQNPIQRMYLNLTMEKLRARFSNHLIAVSESTKKDIVDLLGIPDQKVTVVYEGVERSRFAANLKSQISSLKAVRKKYGIEENYLLFVGTIQPRKNLVRLIEAFAGLIRRGKWEGGNGKWDIEVGNWKKSKRPPLSPRSETTLTSHLSHLASNLQLILAGQPGWMADEIYAAPQKFGVEGRIKFVDYVTDEDLPFLYAGARAFVLPSLHEGFGLPVLEAMAVGTPVVCSRASSLPEVGGKAALYMDPLDTKDIAAKLGQVLSEDRVERKRRIQAGLAQAAQFSWQKCARQTLAVFEQALADEPI